MKTQKYSDLKPYTGISISDKIDLYQLLNQILDSKIQVNKLRSSKSIVLYGAGNLGKMTSEFMDYFKIPYLYTVDINAKIKVKETYWKNRKIITPDEVTEKEKGDNLLILCVATAPVTKLMKKLHDTGWKNIVPAYDFMQMYSDKHPLNNGWFVDKLSDKEKSVIEGVFSKFEDETSRRHYLQFLAWRKDRVELHFKEKILDNSNKFFIPEMKIGKKETFVDCGAHHGLMIERFISKSKNIYEKIYAIEPDNINLKVLKVNSQKLKYQILPYALDKQSSKNRFYEGFNFASRIDPKGNASVQTKKIDDLNLKPTFIKMHLEGGELNALKGSINTIKNCRPKLTITTYHNSDGLYKIPALLMNRLKEYRYYFRLHAYSGSESVLYCIPK